MALLQPLRRRVVPEDVEPDLVDLDGLRLDGLVAPQAMEAKLIDQIGYLDDAIGTVLSLAGLTDAKVVEYRRPFSFMDVLSVQSRATLKLDRNTLYELSTPQLLYMWNAH